MRGVLTSVRYCISVHIRSNYAPTDSSIGKNSHMSPRLATLIKKNKQIIKGIVVSQSRGSH